MNPIQSYIIKYGQEAKQILLAGIRKVVNAVKVTLGPGGRTVMIRTVFGTVNSTKDGVSVAKSITLEDQGEELGASLIKQVADKSLKDVGDGTTTTCILTEALTSAGMKALASGVNPIAFTRKLSEVVKNKLIPEIKAQSQEVTKKNLAHVAYISTNGDEELSRLVSEAFIKNGKEVIINIENSNTSETKLDSLSGISYNRGYISPAFCDPNSTKAEISHCATLIFDHTIVNTMKVLNLIQAHLDKDQTTPIVVIAEDFPELLKSTIIANRMRQQIPVYLLKAPYFGERMRNMLSDIALITGSTILNPTGPNSLDTADLSVYGSANRVILTSDTTVIQVDYALDAEKSAKVEERINGLQEKLKTTTESFYAEPIRDRISKLMYGVCTIKVGGNSEVEVQEKKDRVDDAIRATRAALFGGISKGAGSIFYDLSQKELSDDALVNSTLSEVLRAPFLQLLANAGLTETEVMKARSENPKATGYDIRNHKAVDLLAEGIIDPTLVLIHSLQNAVSIATQVLTTETLVYPNIKDNK